MGVETVLDSKLLLAAYRAGAFPMAVPPDDKIAWFSPDPRALIPLDERFHISHGLRRALKKGSFQVTFDQDFEKVIKACAVAHGATWISDEVLASYQQLHREGFAHSVEVRLGQELAGGLYGVAIGGAFFGESMFHYETDASKTALVALVERLRAKGFALLDTQWVTPHLTQFGTFHVARTEYLKILERALGLDCQF
jgi:leucyl/phenylalanyl-tRNA--protein transferase